MLNQDFKAHFNSKITPLITVKQKKKSNFVYGTFKFIRWKSDDEMSLKIMEKNSKALK